MEVDHVTVYRWARRFTPLLADAARFARHSPGDRWLVDETYVKANGSGGRCTGCRPVRAGHQRARVGPRNAAAARRFFRRALSKLNATPAEVVIDTTPIYPAMFDELTPSARHHVEQYVNNPIEAGHSQLKHRLRPMRGLRTDRTVQTTIARHAFIRNLAADTTNSPSMSHPRCG